jgi:hypothetical protein
VFDSRHATTYRPYQSITYAKCTKLVTIGA